MEPPVGVRSGGTTSGGVTSTGGFPFRGWGDLAEGAVADAGTDYGDPFIPIPSAAGPVMFYTNNTILYLVASGDGGLIPVASLDNSGNDLVLLAATVDELPGFRRRSSTSTTPPSRRSALTVIQPGPSGRWIQKRCVEPSYIDRGSGPAAAGARGVERGRWSVALRLLHRPELTAQHRPRVSEGQSGLLSQLRELAV